MDWSYFDKFDEAIDKYMPARGEGETMASQIVTAVNKLVYKWYNDGDVYDNTHCLEGWANDLSSYANWLLKYTGEERLLDIIDIWKDEQYEKLLADVADHLLCMEYLDEMSRKTKCGSIYDCDGIFRYSECEEYEDDDEDEDDYEYEDDEEDDE